MPDPPHRAFDILAEHPRLSDLVSITRAVATTAAESRGAAWTDAAKVKALAEEAKLTAEDAGTDLGNALLVLERGAESDGERALARALWAHAIAEQPPKGREEEDRVATDILWLSTHTPFDATGLLDRALGDAAAELWDAVADRVRRVDLGTLPALGRGEAFVGAAALAASSSLAAQKHAAQLATEVRDPALARVLGARPAPEEARLTGELSAAPRGPAATTAMALTGVLFAIHATRLVARAALAYKRPAEVVLSGGAVTLRAKTELLGRVVRERDYVIVREGLVRATREVRYPHIAFYAGLLALAVGSYLGVSTLFDGVRAASPSLLLTGLLIVAAGVLLEVLFGSLEHASAGKCRVLFVPAKGPTLCLAKVDPARADEALAKLVKG